MIIGGHVSAAGGVLKAVDRAVALSFDAFQIHPTAPQSWKPSAIPPEDAAKFKDKIKEYGIKATFFHNIYLTNFASPVDSIWNGSVTITANYLQTANSMGVQGVITHLGSHKGLGLESALSRISEGLSQALQENQYPSTHFIIENTAGGGGTIGISLEEISQILDTVPASFHPYIDICIDTCHALSAGLPIHTRQGLEDFLAEFESRFGLAKLACIHLNDSMFEEGTRKDRHANITQGYFGSEGFHNLLTHPKLANTPFIMEVPGIEKTGPDVWNRDKVYELASLPLPSS